MSTTPIDFSPTPYVQRPIRPTGIREANGWTFKTYRIAAPGLQHDPALYAEVWRVAEAAMPVPAITPGRPGIAFAIEHRGRGIDYFVLAWWDRENELPIRIWVRPQAPGERWRPAEGSESVCVWDMQVVAFERDAYVETMLKPGGTPDRSAYLARQLERG